MTVISWDKRYIPSQDIVVREIAGEVVIVPLAAGIREATDNLFTVNSTGQAIWRRLDGTKTLREVVDDLQDQFAAPREVIENDVLGFVGELLQRCMITEAAG